MTQYVSNPNMTSSLSGWTKSGTGTVTATSAGAHFVVSSGNRVTLSTTFTGPSSGGAVLAGWKMRRNTATSKAIDQITLTGNLPIGVGVGFPRGGNYPEDSFVSMAYVASNGGGTFTLDVAVEGPADLTITGMSVYNTAAAPANIALDSNDCAWTYSVPDNSLTASFTHDGNNEEVNTLNWIFGDGATASGDAGPDGFGVNRHTASHTYAAAGVYNVSLQAVARAGGGNATTTKTITVPSGTFQAGFTYVLDYPSIQVDGSTSVAPSRSPVQRYDWNWGDGSTSVGVNQSHSYSAPGIYNVTLVISNADVQRTSSITKTVVISPPGPTVTNRTDLQLQLAFDDPQALLSSTGLQAEVRPILGADDLKWNWTKNEVPVLTFKAPKTWIQDAIGTNLEGLRSDLVVRVNYGAGWVEPPNGRFVVAVEKSDPLRPDQMVDVTCIGIAGADLEGLYFIPGIITKAYTRDEIKAGYSRLIAASKPGAALRSLLPVAGIAGSGGALLKYLNIDFGDTVDSKGATWTQTISNMTVPPAASGLDLMNTMVDTGALDWYAQGNVIRCFNPGTSGKAAVGAAIPELAAGRDIVSAPQERSLRNKTWGAVVVSGGGNAPITATDTDATSPSHQIAHYRGQRYVAIQADGADTASVALSVAKPTLATLAATINGEMTRELKFFPGMPWMPFRDYQVGDILYAPGPNNTPVLMGVEGITITLSQQNGLGASLALGTVFQVNGLAKKLGSLAGGGGISVGAVGAAPPSAIQGFIKTLVASKVTSDNGAFDAGTPLTLEGVNGSTGTSRLTLSADATGPRVYSLDVYNRTYSDTPNMVVTSAGTLGRSTSASKYKINPETGEAGGAEHDFGDAVLSLEPKVWYDRLTLESFAADQDGEDTPPIKKYPGLIAEDVEAAGLDMFVQTNPSTGEVEGLSYERLWVTLIPIIRDLRDRVVQLEQRLGELNV